MKTDERKALNALVAELRAEVAMLRMRLQDERVPCFFQPAKPPAPTESRREVMERLATAPRT